VPAHLRMSQDNQEESGPEGRSAALSPIERNDVLGDVATSTRKIQGTGTVSFVQNHPYERDRSSSTRPRRERRSQYIRGVRPGYRAALAGVTLGETFRSSANRTSGLTAHLTPRARCSSLG